MSIKVGTVSHGTLRFEDLAPAFLNVLGPLDPLAAEGFERELGGIAELEDPITQSEASGEWLESLVEKINDYTPRHLRFGSHVGDPADFGFWYEEELPERFLQDMELADIADTPQEEAAALRAAIESLLTDIAHLL